MKAISANIVRALNVGAIINCADNSGAKTLQIIGVKGYKGRRRRLAKAGVGDVIYVRVVKGEHKLKHQVHLAVIIRQKKEYRRPNGLRVCFEDNAAILVNKKFDPIASEIKGPVAKEVVERFLPIGKIASRVV